MAFYDEQSDRTNFIINWTATPKGDFGVFAKGYTLAANRLAQLLLEAPRFSDYEAYPVVFLYRHALELSLKQIIYSCSLRLFPEDEGLRKALATVTQTCQEFSDIDLDSYAYRYPIDTKGKRSTRKHQVVNLAAFAARMSSVLEVLDTIRFGLNIEADQAQAVYEDVRRRLTSGVRNLTP
ncbi:MAG: hypothetical protein NTV92_09290 [Candidatus Bipolaricaulota bacterium]|nr:hypothetical protein [Candidatus Bipolaricaulota bacterium]